MSLSRGRVAHPFASSNGDRRVDDPWRDQGELVRGDGGLFATGRPCSPMGSGGRQGPRTSNQNENRACRVPLGLVVGPDGLERARDKLPEAANEHARFANKHVYGGDKATGAGRQALGGP